MAATSTRRPDGAPTGRATRVRLGVALVRVATVLAGLAAVVSHVLALRMDDLVDAAVAEGWLFPFTGEAGEQAMFPATVSFALLALFGATAVLAWTLPDWATGNDHVVLVLLPSALVAAIALLGPALLPLGLAHQQYTHDLYGWWYVPYLVVSAAGYVCCLLVATALLARRRPS